MIFGLDPAGAIFLFAPALIVVGFQLIGRLRLNIPEGYVGVVISGKYKQVELAITRPELLHSGWYSRLKYRWVKVFPLVVIPEGALGFVTSHCGPRNNGLTVAYKPEFGDFTDVEAYLNAGGCMGAQEAVLPAGTYAIHPYAFTVTVLDATNNPYKPYGAFGTDYLPDTNLYTIESDNKGTAVAIYAPQGHNGSFARFFLGDEIVTVRLERVVTTPTSSVSIEWELCRSVDSDGVKEATLLNKLTHQYFDDWNGKSVADFAAQLDKLLEALDEELEYNIGYNAAFMLPTVAIGKE